MTTPLYPEITVRLVGEDGSAFSILGRVRTALHRGGVDADGIADFLKQATDGDYDHLLQTVMAWVEVE